MILNLAKWKLKTATIDTKSCFFSGMIVLDVFSVFVSI